ncbi:hypothetical protein E4U41_005769, partial [Claviceps citrina]
MEYKPVSATITPRIVIHGGAGNILRKNLPAEKYHDYRTPASESSHSLPSALQAATHAVTLLENNPLFNAAHGAVFTRDGINELEASVMVSRGHKKRGVGVMGLRRVRNPILLARKILEHGDEDLDPAAGGGGGGGAQAFVMSRGSGSDNDDDDGDGDAHEPNVPSAQGHSQIWGPTAEKLAQKYGLEMVDPGYFFTQHRWEEHVRALEREDRHKQGTATTATWHPDEYLPQGTVGAVALDEQGVVCAATSTGGLTNKLTGRIGDTPCLGAGFWAEEWPEEGVPVGVGRSASFWARLVGEARPGVSLVGPLKGVLAD